MAEFEQLVVEDLIKGTGTEVNKGGALITAYYRGYLEDGTEFDSSYDRGQMIKGHRKGVVQEGRTGTAEKAKGIVQ